MTPATITVTSLADSGAGTLRDAIEQANLIPRFPSGQQDTIVFAPSLAGTITLQSALPDVTASESIEGPGPSVITVERGIAPGTPDFRIFNFPNYFSQSTISGLTIEGGDLVGANGAGIYNVGQIFLTNCVVKGNTIAGVNGQGTEGAGVYNTGVVIFTNDTIEQNTITSQGGGGGVYGAGIFNDNGNFLVDHSTVQFNTIMGSTSAVGGVGGAGIANLGVNEGFVENSTIADNMVNGSWADGAQGGGINDISALAVTASTITGNLVANSAPFGAQGGGINNAVTLILVDDTIFGNSAQVDGAGSPPANAVVAQGGGIMNQPAAQLTCTYSTINDNNVGIAGQGGGIDNLNPNSLVLVDSIVAGNTSAGAMTFTDVAGAVQSQQSQNNLIGDGVGLTGITNGVLGNLIGTDAAPINPMLGPLAGNGGPTQTEALLPGSPALGAGFAVSVFVDATAFLTTDQRGQPRVSGAAPDMGAYEVQFPPPTVVRLQRFGVHLQPTELVVSFSDAMNPEPATNLSNYRLVRLVRTRHRGFRVAHAIPILSVSYNAAAESVTIIPSRRLPLSFIYRLEINGESSTGLADLAGNYLDAPSAGAPGAYDMIPFGRAALVRPMPPHPQHPMHTSQVGHGTHKP